jgi:hypothetical protein
MKEGAARPFHGGAVRLCQTRSKPNQTGSSPVKPGQIQSNLSDSALSKNNTILSEMLMLVLWSKLHSVRQIKPNQTKSNLHDVKKFKRQGSRFRFQCSKHRNTRTWQKKNDHYFRESTLVRWGL